MKNVIVFFLALSMSYTVNATINLEHNMLECDISESGNLYEEIVLKEYENTDGDNVESTGYAIDYVKGELNSVASDILGRHERVRDRIFTSQIADGEGVWRPDSRNFQLVVNYDDHSQLVVDILNLHRTDENGFAMYSMEINGEGPVVDLIYDRMDDYGIDAANGALECISHFDLNDFVTE